MGSRISFRLSELLDQKDIRVSISCEVFAPDALEDSVAGVTHFITVAEVDFGQFGCFSFDVSPGPQIELSADFNYFRNPEYYAPMMRALFHCGVCFQVIH